MVERLLKERYAIQQCLGKNAGRQTLLARDLQTQELVVIKILTFSADFQWDDLKLFEREATTLQSLSHPAIPRYLDHFEFQTPKTKGLALVQSYIEAKSLAEWVESGRNFNQKEIKQIANNLLEILIYLQHQNPPVIHRDIKPSNILLAERSPFKQKHSALNKGGWLGEVYLVDFGSVQTLAAREGSTVTVVGTYGYMPPEQFGGRAVPASDLYGLGATLIYLVTGVHPAELPQEDLRINFEPKIALSLDFVEWLQWMTEPDLNSRLTTADRALKALEKPREAIPLVVQKPARSRVKITKSRKSLEIIISPYRSLWSVIFEILGLSFILFFALFAGVVFIRAAFITYSWFLGLFAVIVCCFVGIGIFISINLIITEPSSTRLHLDRKQISLTSNWLGFVRYNLRPTSPRMAICKLRSIVNKPTESRPYPHRDIQIWAGTQEYKLITSHLTDGEIDWIAGELSEWLNLPISE
ncbi:serine/threonine-protein kinase [Microcoleus vaginatus]|uniref:serine/threonine-protein kinase n=1 Tax=Microcoleus vaginatus TaxID=119532 RepID=UPI0016857E68|nr:serine/threonine protein kinase [Microcoleus sp. FACHB-84]MBD2010267.1 serine/threonine protein kinase [Microcoleus sp. FACHB-45]